MIKNDVLAHNQVQRSLTAVMAAQALVVAWQNAPPDIPEQVVQQKLKIIIK